MHLLRKKANKPPENQCEYEHCHDVPTWEIRNALNSARRSCYSHLGELIEPGMTNMLVPIGQVHVRHSTSFPTIHPILLERIA